MLSLTNTNRYLGKIRSVLRGDIKNSDTNLDSLREQFELDPSSIDLTPIREDSMLRAEVALEDKYNLFERETGGSSLILFPPITGRGLQYL